MEATPLRTQGQQLPGRPGASPRLLDADCATLESMAQLDGLCRFVELGAMAAAWQHNMA
ncbi:MAG TPA: hypothetical protein VFF79_00960 [Conexibacter sp.]|jgi:hypothetical protein|nr:hypothetical protein [Conexibacter sp.]